MHPLIKAAEQLGCNVMLGAAFDKNEIVGVECFLISETSEKCEIFPTKTFVGDTETQAMDKLYTALAEIFKK